jgi:hypothetical protein
MDDYYIHLYERDIMQLSIENEALQKKIDKNNAEIELKRGFIEEIKKEA